MSVMRLYDAIQAMGGYLLDTGDDRPLSGVSCDSRRIGAGELFIALRGERFDGHDFLAEAQAAGRVPACEDRCGM